MLASRQTYSYRARLMGFSMIEVLVTIVIISIGLLGVAGMHARVSVMEMESYQRSQALVLLDDIDSRVRALRGDLTGPLNQTSGPVIVGPGGTSGYNPSSPADCYGKMGAELQVCQWAAALNGAAEKVAGSNVGAMLGARGCIFRVPPSPTLSPSDPIAEFYLVVVWQGLAATADPDAGTYAADCASGIAFGAGLRRAAVTRVLTPKLDV